MGGNIYLIDLVLCLGVLVKLKKVLILLVVVFFGLIFGIGVVFLCCNLF